MKRARLGIMMARKELTTTAWFYKDMIQRAIFIRDYSFEIHAWQPLDKRCWGFYMIASPMGGMWIVCPMTKYGMSPTAPDFGRNIHERHSDRDRKKERPGIIKPSLSGTTKRELSHRLRRLRSEPSIQVRHYVLEMYSSKFLIMWVLMTKNRFLLPL